MFSRTYTIHFWLFKPFMQRKRATCDRACRQRGRGETSGGPRCPGVGQLPPSPRSGVEDVCLVCTRTDETLVPGRKGERSVRAPTITLSEKANPPGPALRPPQTAHPRRAAPCGGRRAGGPGQHVAARVTGLDGRARRLDFSPGQGSVCDGAARSCARPGRPSTVLIPRWR